MTTSAKRGRRELAEARRAGAGLLVWAFVFSVFVNLLMLTGPLYMLQVYDRVLQSRSVETLVALSVLVAGLYVLMALLDHARGRVMARMAARFQSRLDARVFDATLRRQSGAQEQAASSAALRDLDSVQAFLGAPVLLALMDMPWTPVFIAAIFLFHPMLGWLAVAGGAVIVVLAIANQLLTAERVKTAQAAMQQSHSFAAEARAGREIVLSQGLRQTMTDRWVERRNDALLQGMQANDRTGSFGSATKAFRLFLQSAVLGVGAYYVIQGQVTGGAMIASSILLGRALAPIEQAMGQWAVLQKAVAGWGALARYLDTVPPEQKRLDLPVPEGRLRVSGLSVAPPGARAPTLHGISFEVRPGTALGVIGKSGSGKSTLARALLGYWKPVEGEIRLGGAALDLYDPERLGQHIGYLPQSVTLFGGTVAENIARMARVPDGREVVAAAKRANAHEIILNLPDGYDTVLTGQENQLSGGQRQRIALARALYGGPSLLILDEPNSALDVEGSEALNLAVRQFKEAGKAVIIMTHRPLAIAECDHLLVLENGMISAYGLRDEVLQRAVRNAGQVHQAIRQKEAS